VRPRLVTRGGARRRGESSSAGHESPHSARIGEELGTRGYGDGVAVPCSAAARPQFLSSENWGAWCAGFQFIWGTHALCTDALGHWGIGGLEF
jgi:hypothetical protein